LANFNLIKNEILLGNKAKGLADLKALAAAHPDFLEGVILLADLLTEQNLLKDANQILQEFLKHDPKPAVIYTRLMQNYLKQGDWKALEEVSGTLEKKVAEETIK